MLGGRVWLLWLQMVAARASRLAAAWSAFADSLFGMKDEKERYEAIVARVAAKMQNAGVARALLYHGLRMGLFPSMKRSLGLSQTNVLGKMVAGAACGAVGSVICNPLDLVA